MPRANRHRLIEVHFSPLGPVPPHEASHLLATNNPPAPAPEPDPSRLMWFDPVLGCFRSAHTRPAEPPAPIGPRYSRLR